MDSYTGKSADDLKNLWKEEDEQAINQAYIALLETPVGRKFLRHLLELGKIGQQPFTTNALAMSFACGELNVGQQILTELLTARPEGWIMMQKEANDEWKSRNSYISRANPRNHDDSDFG